MAEELPSEMSEEEKNKIKEALVLSEAQAVAYDPYNLRKKSPAGLTEMMGAVSSPEEMKKLMVEDELPRLERSGMAVVRFCETGTFEKMYRIDWVTVATAHDWGEGLASNDGCLDAGGLGDGGLEDLDPVDMNDVKTPQLQPMDAAKSVLKG